MRTFKLFFEPMSIRSFEGKKPNIHPSAYVDPDATVIGQVEIGHDASLWPGAVARGDVEQIIIGPETSIQDGTVLHVTHDGPFTPGGRNLIIGRGVTVGHQAMLHACTIGNYCLIGMSATIMDDVIVGEQCLIAAGSVIPPGKRVEPNSLWRGSPARFVRDLSEREIENLHYSAKNYVHLKNRYLSAQQTSADRSHL